MSMPMFDKFYIDSYQQTVIYDVFTLLMIIIYNYNKLTYGVSPSTVSIFTVKVTDAILFMYLSA